MKISDIFESTCAGAIAPVAMPMTTQKRTKESVSVPGLQPVEKVMKGKAKKKGPYANSINESAGSMERTDPVTGEVESVLTAAKHFLYALDRGYLNCKDDSEFIDALRRAVARESKLPVQEAHLEEDDLILMPGKGNKLKTGFHSYDPDKAEREGETLKNSLRTIVRVASSLNKRLENQDDFPEWVSEKVGAIKGMMTSVMQYLASEQEAGHEFASEGAKVDRMVKHIAKSERDTGKSKDKATDIAWATANKRGYLDNANKKKSK